MNSSYFGSGWLLSRYSCLWGYLFNGERVSFKGNRSFTRNFSSKSKTAIRKYFRKNKTKVKHANDYEMELLIEFINTLAS